MGLPEETLSDMKRSIDFVKKTNFDYLSLNVMWVEPFVGFNEKLHLDIHDVPTAHALQKMNFEHPFVSNDQIEKFYRKCFRDFYLNPRFIIKQLAGIRSIKKIRKTVDIFRELSIGGKL